MKNPQRFLCVLSVAIVLAACGRAPSSWVDFESTAPGAAKLQLKGILTKPDGTGPFPTVVMLCGCGGLKDPRDAKQMAAWAGRLAGWGYASLQVDSFGPRGYDDGICDHLDLLDDRQRSYDAYSAKTFLAKQTYVDPNHMAVIGWSHGGSTVLRLADASRRDGAFPPFQAAVAFYPWCDPIVKLGAPLLILSGARDEICPARRCQMLENLAGVKESEYEFSVQVYPDAYHSFDQEGVEGEMGGKRFGYNKAATEEAIVQVRDFLAKYLDK